MAPNILAGKFDVSCPNKARVPKPELVIFTTAIHDALIAEHGGPPGLRDPGLLASATARPKQLAAYGKPSVFDLAAAYAHALAKNHPFVDGNKRTALMACYVFMRLNGYRMTATEPDAVATFLAIADGKLSDSKLGAWLKVNIARAGVRGQKKPRG